MNLGIQHSSCHPNLRKTPGRNMDTLPPLTSLSKFASQMGIDVTDLGDKAEQMWANLNDLHASDPEGYQSFIEQQMEMNQEFMKNQNTFKKSIVPHPGFVIQVAYGKNQNSVFVNICHHEAVQCPLDQQNNPISLQTVDTNNLQISLIVSPFRTNENDICKEDTIIATIDVIVHPWCIHAAKENNVFKYQLIKLCLEWAVQESKLESVNVENGWKLVENVKYKRCTKVNNEDCKKDDDVLPFEVILPLTNQSETKNHDTELSNIPDAIDKPEQLLSHRYHHYEPQKEMSIETAINKRQGSSDKPLIQEITSCNTSKNVTGKTKPLAKSMKGFLLNKTKNGKNRRLYDDKGSTGDGLNGTGGSYVRLLSKCQVVDQTETVDHREKSFEKERSKNAIETKKKYPNESLPIEKGFVQKKKQSIENFRERVKQENRNDNRIGTFEAEFDKLTAQLDPEFTNVLCKANADSNRQENAEFLSQLATLTNESSEITEDNQQSTLKTEANEKIDYDTIVQNKENINFDVSRKEEKIIFDVDLSNCSFESLKLSSIALSVSNSSIKLRTACDKHIEYDFDVPINAHEVSAKLNKRMKQLKVVCPTLK